jgi:hypothetical protein
MSHLGFSDVDTAPLGWPVGLDLPEGDGRPVMQDLFVEGLLVEELGYRAYRQI